MAPKTSILVLITIFSSFTLALCTNSHKYDPWRVLKRSIGISAMHMALLPNERIIIFDRTNFGPSNLTLPEGKCPKSSEQSTDCYAHSVEFDPSNHNVRPLTILTDTWCSSGALSPDGVLIQSGGFQSGERVVRYFKPCLDCDWIEHLNELNSPRWYASNQILPDGKIIVVGGRFQFSYEFIPKNSIPDQKLYQLPFLEETLYSSTVPNNLYPFLHLSPDGNLFVFANDRAILLDYANNIVVRRYPIMPGGVSRNYPSTGSSALLPLNLTEDSTTPDAVVLVCGGTVPESNVKAMAGIFLPATKSCGRIVITATNPKWEMEDMPIERVMGDMILLPTGEVLVINGAKRGSAGWNVAIEPVLNPVLYRPREQILNRFEVLSPTKIPRLYHSTAHLLSDGRVLVGGSNPNPNYNFSVVYPTELSLEAFAPPYLSSKKHSRPLIRWIKPETKMNYKEKISVGFRSKHRPEDVYVTMVAPSFTTHSFAMNQRVLVLDMGKMAREKKTGSGYVIEGFAPATAEIAPPGYYFLFVVRDGVPSRGVWVQIK
ncbi:hypothetical protein UlMin_001703 [Ulmus minor]